MKVPVLTSLGNEVNKRYAQLDTTAEMKIPDLPSGFNRHRNGGEKALIDGFEFIIGMIQADLFKEIIVYSDYNDRHVKN